MRPTLTHIALHVRDVVAATEFYKEFCGLRPVHERPDSEHDDKVVWLAEPGREASLIFVFIGHGPGTVRQAGDYGHLGFACDSRAEVDAIAAKARRQGRLIWEPRQEAFPVGYYCGVADPDGNPVEFSFGQPLGPGASKDLGHLVAGFPERRYYADDAEIPERPGPKSRGEGRSGDPAPP
jgi:catechol 2,3-dioxygenase-like lactoylglutathione lyase family enzyme